MRAFQRGDDPLFLRQPTVGVDRFVIGDRDIVHPACVVQQGVFRPDARVVQAG
ncbi:hypothetical protein D3C72_1967370 [compost metagenome]